MANQNNRSETYWSTVWKRFKNHPLGISAFFVVIAFCLIAIYAPFIASSKPLFVEYQGEWYFPLFRYLFYKGFYTKNLDLFFNLMIFTFPLLILSIWWIQARRLLWISFVALQTLGFLYILYSPIKDPAANTALTIQRMDTVRSGKKLSWLEELRYMSPYAQLNLVLRYKQRKKQDQELRAYATEYFKATGNSSLPTLWQVERDNEAQERKRYETLLKNPSEQSPMALQQTNERLNYLSERQNWLETQSNQISLEVMPLLSPFHWEDDAGGQQALNKYVPWTDLTRINRKDLLSSLVFGTRISLVVGIASITLALLIGIPIGALAGFYGGKSDIVVCRLLEVWESMPTLFVLLLAVSMLQTKSIFLVITIIGIFGWTGFSRYIRGEFLKQRNLPYVEAERALGFNNGYIVFKHILPNAIPPVLTLLPFAIMGAISAEAGLSFLGLGEENSCSWGILMDEGRTAFPEESYLLWPPALALTALLVAIAIVGDSLRDVIDPKFQRA